MRWAACLFAFLFAGCGEDPGCVDAVAAPPVVVRAVESAFAARDSQRIVSTLPGITEIVAYLGAFDRLVGVSPHCDMPDTVTALPRIGVMPLDVEAVLALDADLVIVDRSLFRSRLPELRRHIPGLLALETSRSLPDLAASMDTLATVLGTPEARSQSDAWRAALDALTVRLANDRPDPPPRVLVVSEWEPLNVIGPGALIDDCLRLCGCVNVACDLSGPSGPFDEELVVARRPEFILHRAALLPPDVADRWAGVPGVAPGRIGPCETDDLSRGGPRILDALRRLAAVLHGEAEVDTLVAEPSK